MLASLNEQRNALISRIGELKSALEVVQDGNLGNDVLFKAADCLYARARVINPDKKMLWLGVSNTPDSAAPSYV